MVNTLPVSVIMAVYNSQRFLRSAIDSVLSQTFKEFELLVVDDGSNDRSMDIVREYSKRDPRIVCIQGTHKGAAACRNVGLARARGQFVAIMDSDDRMLPNRLERQMAFLAERPALSVACSYAYVIDVQDRRIGRSEHRVDVERGRRELKPSLFLEIVHSSAIIRNDIFLTTGGYRQELTPLEDRDLWGRIVTAGYQIACQEECLVEYRLHGGSLTATKHTRDVSEMIGINVIRRLKGLPELPVEAFAELQKGLPFGNRARSWARFRAMLCYKNATRHYAERNILSCMVALLGAVILRPLWSLARIASKLESRHLNR